MALAGFTKIKPVVLAAPSALQENRVWEVALPWETGMNPDFSDVRFLDSDGLTELGQVPVKRVLSDSSIWLVKVPSVSVAGKTIYVNFCNATAVLKEDLDDVLVFWDRGNVAGTSKWSEHYTGSNPGTLVKSGGSLILSSCGSVSGGGDYFYAVMSAALGTGNLSFWTKAKQKNRGGSYETIIFGQDADTGSLYHRFRAVAGGTQELDGAGGATSTSAVSMPDDAWRHYRLRKFTGVKIDIEIFDSGWDVVLANTANANKPTSCFADAVPFQLFVSQATNVGPATMLYLEWLYAYDAAEDVTATPGTTADVPVPDFSGAPLDGTIPLSVVFTDLTTNSPTSWLWTFGDGGTSTDQNPTHSYAAAGSYTVTLTVYKTIDGVIHSAVISKTAYVTARNSARNSLLDDIAFRIKNPKGDKWQYFPHIVRTVDRLYHRLCREYRLVQKSLSMDFSTLGTFVQYWALPSDFHKLLHLASSEIDHFDWRVPNEFDSTEIGTYTITLNRIYFGGIDATAVISMVYQSTGSEFTMSTTPGTGETNTPEWADRGLDQVLYYGACIELKEDYPNRNMDVELFGVLMRQLADGFYDVQDRDFETPGDPPADGAIDAYDY